MLNSEADANVSSVCGTEHPSQMLERFRKRRSETRVEFRPAKPQDKTAETDVSNDCKTHLLALRACKPCWLTSTLTSVFVAHSVRADVSGYINRPYELAVPQNRTTKEARE